MGIIVVLLLSCMFVYAGFVLYSAYHFRRARCKDSVQKPQASVSIIIPARNEAKHILDCLTSILNQDYPAERVEIILINDHSTDETKNLALKLAKEDTRLKVFDLAVDHINSYKKAAITQGISLSKGEIILQTDADCWVSPQWVSQMLAQFEKEVVFVSGPVYLVAGKSWMGKFQSLESMGLVALGGGAMTAGHPNMCNGANMAYRRSAFEQIGGYTQIDQIASGDDELLMQKMRKHFPNGLRFAKCTQAIVRTHTLTHWKALRAQRIRWLSKARFYKNRWTNVIQLISYLAFCGFPFFLFGSIWDSSYLWYLLFISLVKLLADLAIMVPAARFFHNLRLLAYLIPLQVVYIVYVLWIGIRGNFVYNYDWKDRKVR